MMMGLENKILYVDMDGVLTKWEDAASEIAEKMLMIMKMD